MSDIPPLYGHQKESIKFCLANSRVLDASDPGTAKTRVQVEVFAERKKFDDKSALIICPKSLMRSVWENDFRTFAPEIEVVIAPATKRREAFDTPADVYVTNTDATRWLVTQPKSFFHRFNTLVVDEFHTFKHRTSQRSRALDKIRGYFQYRYGLTGTPYTNTICDVWNQVHILDDGQHLGNSFFQFRNTVQTAEQSGPQANMLKWTDKSGAENVVMQMISAMTIRHKLADCTDIPAQYAYSIPYYMSSKQTKAYEEMRKEAIALLESGTIISAVNAAAVRTKLLQIASGAVYIKPKQYTVVDSGRYELVKDLVAEREHSIVFFLWTHQKELLRKEFEKQGITYAIIDGTVSEKERHRIVEYYQAGFYQTLLAHPDTTAYGFTLTKGTAVIWASPPDRLDFWIQGNKRIHRATQTQKTETINVLAKGTIDEKVFAALQDKNARQLTGLELLRDISRERMQ